MADQRLAVPQVEAVAGRLGDDHRPAVGRGGVDLAQVERHLRRGRRADRDAGPGPGGDDRAVDMAGEHRDDMVVARDHLLDLGRPGLVGGDRHPVDAGLHRRMVEEDDDGPVGLGEPRLQPGGTRLAEAAAVAAIFERVEQDDAQRPLVDRILDEAVMRRHFGEDLAEGLAQIMVAHHRQHRHAAAVEQALQGAIILDDAILGEVAAGDDQVGLPRHRRDLAQHRVEPGAVHFLGIARVEADVDVGDLRDQQRRRAALAAGACARLDIRVHGSGAAPSRLRIGPHALIPIIASRCRYARAAFPDD